MAGKYASQSWTIQVDDAPGGSLTSITQYVTSLSGIKLNAANQLTHTFGDSFQESTPSGMGSIDDITIEGFFDTTASTGPHAMLSAPDDGPQDATRTFTVSPGDSKTFSGETRLMSYEVLGVVGELTKYRAVLRPTGSFAWA